MTAEIAIAEADRPTTGEDRAAMLAAKGCEPGAPTLAPSPVVMGTVPGAAPAMAAAAVVAEDDGGGQRTRSKRARVGRISAPAGAAARSRRERALSIARSCTRRKQSCWRKRTFCESDSLTVLDGWAVMVAAAEAATAVAEVAVGLCDLEGGALCRGALRGDVF